MRGRHHLAAAAALVFGVALGVACGTQIPDDQPYIAAQPGSDGAADGSIAIPDGASPGDPGGADGSADGPAAPCGLHAADGRPLVFVTSETFSGAAPVAINESGAPFFDSRCTELAHAAGFSGSFKAWVYSPGETPNSSPESRIGGSPVGWARRDGKLVFAGPTPSASLLVPINVTEKCTTLDDDLGAWTGVSSNVVSMTCGDWNQTNSEGHFGDPNATGETWQEKETGPCSLKRHLYCFQTSN